MTPATFRSIRRRLGLSQTAMGRRLGPENRPYSLRAVQSWESGEREIPPAVELILTNHKMLLVLSAEQQGKD